MTLKYVGVGQASGFDLELSDGRSSRLSKDDWAGFVVSAIAESATADFRPIAEIGSQR